jgi:hypothetical protein
MPRFNRHGDVTPQLGYHWYGDRLLIHQDCETRCEVDGCPSVNGCHVRLSNGAIVAHRATTLLMANGRGAWAYVEFAGPQDPTQARTHDSFGRTHVGWGPAAMGPDGSIALKPHSNIGTVVLEPDGSEWRLPELALEIQLLSDRRAIWTEGGIVHSNFAIVGNPGVPVWWPRVTDDGRLLYQRQSDGALVFAGKRLAPGGDYYYPDVRLIDGVYHVCWSPSQNDTNAQIRRLTPAQLAALPDATTPPAPPIPVPVPPPPPEPPAMDYLQIIRDIRRDYPTPLGARHWEFLVEVAQATRTQLFRKEDSNSVLIPALNKRVSLDIIGRGSLGNQWADILMDSEGRAEPAFQLHQGAAGEYVDVSQVELPGEPPPAPPPPPTPPTDEDVLRAIVRAAVSDLRNVVALLDRAVNE